MDFTLSEMQEMLRTSAKDFLKTNCPKGLVRQMAKDEKGYTNELWQQMSEMGWMGLIVPEKYGGADGSFLDLVVLLEEMGRACLPGPFFSTVLLGGLSIMEAGNEEQQKEYLSKMAEGKLLLTLALLETSASYKADGIKVKALPEGNDYIIQGTKLFVPDAHVSDYMVCAVRTKDDGKPEDGITLFIIDSKTPGITINMLNTISGDKQCEVIFDKVKVPSANILGSLNQGWPLMEKILEKVTVARCADMIGGAKAMMDLTLDYAKQRKAFGKHIGSFQIIQHNCANMLIEVDGSSLVVNEIAWRLSEGLPAADEVHIAKALVNEGVRHASAICMQINGAIGFTEDHDMSIYYKRAKTTEIDMGTSHFHLDNLAESKVK
ncbi:MAG: acyl-CoA/acyl-ACP dehydrogenase [Dehalococcoidales bacterium]|nr:acyl-CoA/acyl-ACP dehydrogenase [Dehalococcoidales bacterium]